MFGNGSLFYLIALISLNPFSITKALSVCFSLKLLGLMWNINWYYSSFFLFYTWSLRAVLIPLIVLIILNPFYILSRHLGLLKAIFPCYGKTSISGIYIHLPLISAAGLPSVPDSFDWIDYPESFLHLLKCCCFVWVINYLDFRNLFYLTIYSF